MLSNTSAMATNHPLSFCTIPYQAAGVQASLRYVVHACMQAEECRPAYMWVQTRWWRSGHTRLYCICNNGAGFSERLLLPMQARRRSCLAGQPQRRGLGAARWAPRGSSPSAAAGPLLAHLRARSARVCCLSKKPPAQLGFHGNPRAAREYASHAGERTCCWHAFQGSISTRSLVAAGAGSHVSSTWQSLTCGRP